MRQDTAVTIVGAMNFPGQIRRRRNRLLWRIHRSYATTTQDVQIGGLKFPFTRITDPDVVLDRVAAEADRRERASGRREIDEHLHLPYWAELWDSAMGLGQYLVRTRADPEIARRGTSLKVLDLGCGMGLSGTVAAALGAAVTFADIESPALLFARLNSLPWRKQVTTRRLNWRTDRLGRTFDLILGADILYERAQWEFLEPFWKSHLAPGGVVLLAEPGRQTGDLFLDWIRERPWQMRLIEENVATRANPIRIFELRQKS
jgi:predicted nicotinamide N-methyase